jgi:hypothetical protein
MYISVCYDPQSDSESDLSLAQRSNASAASRMNGLMRPTISSQNKVTSLGGSKSMTSSQTARRRGLTAAYSSGNYLTTKCKEVHLAL